MSTKTNTKALAVVRSLAAHRAHLTMAQRAVKAAKGKARRVASDRLSAIRERHNKFAKANAKLIWKAGRLAELA